MNTDAQRARNARKRAKLRAKRRGVGCQVYRFMLSAFLDCRNYRVFFEPGRGLLANALHVPREKFTRDKIATDWLVSTSHEVNSSALGAIHSFVNQVMGYDLHPEDGEAGTLRLTVERNGETRRFTWHVEEVDVGILAAGIVAELAGAVAS